MDTSLEALFARAPAVNPLIAPLRKYFSVAGASASEYQLIYLLRERGHLPERGNGSALALFRVHFAVFNALYQLQEELADKGLRLHISPLSIWLQAGVGRNTLPGDVTEDPLREFYLDWSRGKDATEQSVLELLTGFWGRCGTGGLNRDEHDRALAALDLSPPVNYSDIKRRYRQLAMIHHPDRGGEGTELQVLNAAMAVLDRHYTKGGSGR